MFGMEPLFSDACKTAWDAGDASEKERALAVATDLIWKLSGRVFGLSPEVLRPCFGPPRPSLYEGRSHSGHREAGYFWPGVINGTQFTGSCGCVSDCSCVGPSEISLVGPVHSVVEVLIDGEIIDAGMYRLRNRRWLVRTDGLPWPQTQDMSVADNAVGAFTVAYLRGIVLPVAGQYALGDLACEFLKASSNEACRIPDRAMSLSRQGVDIQLLDPAVLFDGGFTGVSSVDLWIASVNPGKTRQQPYIASPDVRLR